MRKSPLEKIPPGPRSSFKCPEDSRGVVASIYIEESKVYGLVGVDE